MATYTITTPVNIDSLASKVGSDTYNINGGYLTVDQDTRYGTNQNVSAAMGNITLSATLGGSIEFNSTKIRLIPYNTGTGNVPALGTTISQGSASGILLGVYSALNVAPTTAGSAMPASGYIKIRQWNSIAYSSGALTGIAATSTGADIAGWMEIVGVDALTCTVNRLNTFKVRGDWFEFLGTTTSGTRTTQYQIPSNGSAVYAPGVWVETDTGSGIYEFYPCFGTLTALAANIATDSLRGKVCWISSAGLVSFGYDGTNSTGGYCPPSGRKIRIPNIFFNTCTAAALTVNSLPNATLATRYEFLTTGGGTLDIDKCSINWYVNLSQAYSANISNTGILTSATLSEIATPLTWTNVGIGQEAANTQIALNLSFCFAGGTFTDCTYLRSAQAGSGAYVLSSTDINGFTFNNCQFRTTVKAANATTGSINLIRGVNCVFNNTVLGAGRVFQTTCINNDFNNTIYFDHPAVNTLAAIPMFAFDIGTNCINCNYTGLSFGGLYMTQPYSGILNIGAAGCSNIKLRNIGTKDVPLSLGSPQLNGISWTRATTTATITSTAHGLAVNDIIYVIISSDVAAIIVGAKTVASVPTANTFTFTCLNAGAASGTLSYFGQKSGTVFTIAAGSAANNVKIQKVYTPHTRTNMYTADNSAKNVLMENIFGDYISAPIPVMLNGYFKNINAILPSAAQTAVYGTHWFNSYICDPSTSKTSQPYTRATTTATITSNAHGLRTGMIININPSTAPTTFTSTQYSVTVLTANTFTVTVANAGAASGNLDYSIANGRLGLLMNEASTETLPTYTIDSGAVAFTSAGGLYMPNVNDQITFITPNYIIGQGANFPIFEVIMAGSTLTRYTIQYALDLNNGSGYGSFHNLYYERAGGSGSSGAGTFTVTDATGVEIGDYVWGTGISPLAKVTNIVSNTITVDKNNIATVSGIIRFNHLPSETGIDSELGIKMKWRIKTVTANTVPITSLYIQTESVDIDRTYQYPLDTVNVTLTGLKTGSEVRVYLDSSGDNGSEIAGTESSGTSYSFSVESGKTINIIINNLNYLPADIWQLVIGSTDLTIPISQFIDRQYYNV